VIKYFSHNTHKSISSIGYRLKNTNIAMAGYCYLLLSPFSIISYPIQNATAVLCLLVGLLKPKLVKIETEGVKKIYNFSFFVFLYTLTVSVISIVNLSLNDSSEIWKIISRWGVQELSLSLNLFQLLCGYYLANSYKSHQIRNVIMFSYCITLLTGYYQIFAHALNLPFLGHFSEDVKVGLRPTGLALEPKYLSGYLAGFMGYLGCRSVFDKCSNRVFNISVLILSLFLFLKCSAANGLVSLLVTIFTLFLVSKIYSRLILSFSMVLIVLAFGSLNPDLILIRDSHAEILNNASNLNLLIFDDLIFLPMFAWLDNPIKALFGFGPGLMHFFAQKHLSQASWVTVDNIIEGNLSIIMYISNMGVFLVGFILIFVLRLVSHVSAAHRGKEDFSLCVYFSVMSLISLTVSGPISVPGILSIGWLLGKSKSLVKT